MSDFTVTAFLLSDPMLAVNLLNATVNAAIAGGAMTSALALVWLIVKRRDLRFRALFVLFALMFLVAALAAIAGTGLLSLPRSWGMILKGFAAVMAWVAAVCLVRALPTLLTASDFSQIRKELEGAVAGRRKAEEQIERLNVDLQHRVQELQALLDVLPMGIGIAMDAECKDIRTNRAFAEILRLTPKANASLTAARQEAPTNFKVLSGGRELSPKELPIQRAAATGEVVREIEEEIVFSDGRRAHLLGYAAPLLDATKTVRGAVGAFVDITERKRAEEERLRVEHKLQESQKLESLGVLAGGIAHDFNNLLTGVIGNASLALVDLPADSPLGECLREIEDAAQRAADLCKQMLAYAGRGRFVVENLDLNRVIRETASLLQSSVSKNAALRFDLAATPLPTVQADATQLRQILMNLVINASEAIGAGPGTISVKTGVLTADRAYLETATVGADLPVGDYVLLEVRDTGSGMPPEILERIFDPFFTTKFTGRGLGLAATLGIVRGHRGAVRVESEAGRGTAFHILLPSVDATATTAAPSFATPQRWRGTGTVLVVDDEATIRSTATRMLESLGFQVITAEDGTAGVETLRARPAVAAILLDLTMPRMSGEETFREFRQIRADVPVVLMSGFNEMEAVMPFHGKGLSGFLQKPFTAATLQACLAEVLPAG